MDRNILNAPGIRVFNGYAPEKGPTTMPIDFDFTLAARYDIDFLEAVEFGKIDFIQTVYIDNAGNNQALTLTFEMSGQVIICPANSQGYFPALVPSKPRFTVSLPNLSTNAHTVIQFISVPLPALVWSATPANAAPASTPFRIISAATTNSGTIKNAAGTLTLLSATNNGANPAYVKIYNKANPVVGTDIPVLVLEAAASGGGFVIPVPMAFGAAIGIGITGGIADNDTTAIAANQVAVSGAYL